MNEPFHHMGKSKKPQTILELKKKTLHGHMATDHIAIQSNLFPNGKVLTVQSYNRCAYSRQFTTHMPNFGTVHPSKFCLSLSLSVSIYIDTHICKEGKRFIVKIWESEVQKSKETRRLKHKKRCTNWQLSACRVVITRRKG